MISPCQWRILCSLQTVIWNNISFSFNSQRRISISLLTMECQNHNYLVSFLDNWCEEFGWQTKKLELGVWLKRGLSEYFNYISWWLQVLKNDIDSPCSCSECWNFLHHKQIHSLYVKLLNWESKFLILVKPWYEQIISQGKSK